MLHVSSLFVARTAEFDESGSINATCIPMTWFHVDQLPLLGTVPIVLVVHAPSGGDYDPDVHVICKDPDGAPRGALRAAWHWPDEGNRPSKYRCFTQDLSFTIESEGQYTIGVYYDAAGKIELSTPVPVAIYLAEAVPAGQENEEG